MRDTRMGTLLMTMAMLVFAASDSDAQTRRIAKRDFTIYGPWLVAGNALGIPNASDPERARALPRQPPTNDDRTPSPYSTFVDTAMLGGIDPGIAVGKEFVLLTDDMNGIAVYRRDGSLVQRGSFPLVIKLDMLFKPASHDATAKLTYPSGMPDVWNTGIVQYGDVRVAYDAWRGRFWIYSRAAPERPKKGEDVLEYPILRLARRNKAMVAVSRTEDPRDGFITYWWDETYRNGSCLVSSPCGDRVFKISGEGSDYPTVAVAPKLFVMTAAANRYDPSFDVSTLTKAKDWVACKTGFVHDGTPSPLCGPFYSYLMLVDADTLAAGCGKIPTGRGDATNCPVGRAFGVFIDKDNWITDWVDDAKTAFASGMARAVRPVTI